MLSVTEKGIRLGVKTGVRSGTGGESMLKEILRTVEENNVRYLQLRFVDTAGIMRTKAVLSPSFQSALQHGVNFSKTIMSFTALDRLVDEPSYHAADGDFWAVPDLESFVFSPLQPDTAYVYCNLLEPDGSPFPGCYRTLLKKLLAEAESIWGGSVVGTFEPEFMVIDAEPGVLGNRAQIFSVQNLEKVKPLIDGIIESAGRMGLPLLQVSSEASPNQYEINLGKMSLIEACDSWLSLRELIRNVAGRLGYWATFLPKPMANLPGNGLHLHLSVEASGLNLFASDSDLDPLSALARNFLGGVMAHGRALTALGAASVNSYKRFLPNQWAPTCLNWGIGNRAAFVRVPEEKINSHLEIRCCDATCNPYLFAAGVLAAGLMGTASGIDPGTPCQDITPFRNEYTLLPVHLGEAIDALATDSDLNKLLGSTGVSQYIKVKRQEWCSYLSTVTDWDQQFMTIF